ncbi:MAG TPA: transcription elongation factor GreA [Firmicutes bacterium]|nr:transcription elongation factor GreA [Bacillota bacterium]
MADRPDKELVLTAEGLRKLAAELEHLRNVRRAEVANRIREALEFGDAWENPEYESAKNEQAFVEGRIAELENLLRNATLIEGPGGPADVVALGSWVRLRDCASQDEFEYCIVGTAEADPFKNRISNQSPVAQAVLGHRVGERVRVQVPAGPVEFEILDVHTGERALTPPDAETA